VVSSTKDARPSKGKDYEIAKWEEGVRKSLAAKKALPVTLTKQQEALFKAQLEKEAKIRQAMKMIHARLVRGLHFIQSLVAANVQELQSYMTELTTLLIDGALSRGSILAGATAYETYLVSVIPYLLSPAHGPKDLSKCTSDRLGYLKQWIGIATLRCLRNVSIPDEVQVEPLHRRIFLLFYQFLLISKDSSGRSNTLSTTIPL